MAIDSNDPIEIERKSTASERVNDEMSRAFYDLEGFIGREIKTLRKFMKTLTNPAKVDEKALAKIAKQFQARVERYAQAKDNLRKQASIIHPDVGVS